MLSIREISGDELYPVWEWDERDPDDPYPKTSWDDYLTRYSQPRFTHYGIFKAGVLAACLTIELWSATDYEAHISSARHLLTPQELRRAVMALQKAVIANGAKRIICFIPSYLRAAQRLAIACGLRRANEYSTAMMFRGKPVILIKFTYEKE